MSRIIYYIIHFLNRYSILYRIKNSISNIFSLFHTRDRPEQLFHAPTERRGEGSENRSSEHGARRCFRRWTCENAKFFVHVYKTSKFEWYTYWMHFTIKTLHRIHLLIINHRQRDHRNRTKWYYLPYIVGVLIVLVAS